MTGIHKHMGASSLLATALIASTLSSGITGCADDPAGAPPPSASAEQQPPNWPQKLADFRFRWAAVPGFDLTTGWAVPLRAYLESWRVVRYTGELDFSYPGYSRATPPPIESGSTKLMETPYQEREIRQSRRMPDYAQSDEPIVGTEDFFVLRAEPVADGFRAFVCDSTIRTYVAAIDSGRPRPISSLPGYTPTDVDTMKVWRIEFTDGNTGRDSPPSPETPQSGPQPAPSTDVFGSWFVTGAEAVSGWSDADSAIPDPASAETAMRKQCLERYPLDAAQRRQLSMTTLDAPPPVERPIPGWPDAG